MKNNKLFIIMGILVLILFAAVITNPGEQKHRDALKTELKSYVPEIVKEKFGVSNDFLDNMILNAVDNMVVVHNRFIFSTTNVVWGDKVYTVGYGLFGHVFISPKVAAILNSGDLFDINF